MSDYPMLISNKLHSFRNFFRQIYKTFSKKHSPTCKNIEIIPWKKTEEASRFSPACPFKERKLTRFGTIIQSSILPELFFYLPLRRTQIKIAKKARMAGQSPISTIFQ